MAVAALFVLGIAGGIAGGGIFTIVLLPVAVIILVAGIAYRGMGHAAESGSGASSGGPAPLPHSSPTDPARVQSSPEGLTDARRAQQ